MPQSPPESGRRRRHSIDDLTVVIGLRAHEGNPWVLERLSCLGEHYDPRPRFLVVDFGSRDRYAAAVERICRDSEIERLYVEDTGVFSAAVARNAGAAAARTELVFFSDVDCLGERDLFARLIRHANELELGVCFDQIVTLPVYHLAARATQHVMRAADARERSDRIARAMTMSVYSGRDDVAEYVDPFSNFYLCHRQFFDLIGGYDESFRGHGSEDFELLLRFFVHSGQFPLPMDPGADEYGPARPEFFGPKPYRGFRRLGELAALQAEAAGLRIAHLHHGRADADPWYRHNDWSRERFGSRVANALSGWAPLLELDWMPRSRRVAALLTEDWQAALVLPLRLDGYRVEPIHVPHSRLVEEALRLIAEPSGRSIAMVTQDLEQVAVSRVDERARSAGVELITITPGGHDGTWRFSSAPLEPSAGERLRVEQMLSALGRRADLHPDDAGLSERLLGLGPGDSLYEGRPGVQPLRFIRFCGHTCHGYLRAEQFQAFDASSYAAGRHGVSVRAEEVRALHASTPDKVRRRVPQSVRDEPLVRRLRRKARKLARNPAAFFADADLRWLRRFLHRG